MNLPTLNVMELLLAAEIVGDNAKSHSESYSKLSAGSDIPALTPCIRRQSKPQRRRSFNVGSSKKQVTQQKRRCSETVNSSLNDLLNGQRRRNSHPLASGCRWTSTPEVSELLDSPVRAPRRPLSSVVYSPKPLSPFKESCPSSPMKKPVRLTTRMRSDEPPHQPLRKMTDTLAIIDESLIITL